MRPHLFWARYLYSRKIYLTEEGKRKEGVLETQREWELVYEMILRKVHPFSAGNKGWDRVIQASECKTEKESWSKEGGFWS